MVEKEKKEILESSLVPEFLYEGIKTETSKDISNTIESLTKKQLEENIWEIHDIFNYERNKLNDLRVWINKEWEEREILDSFLDFVWLEKNKETRLGAYNKLSSLSDDSLKGTFKELKLSEEEIEHKIAKIYEFTTNYHIDLHKKLIEDIEKNNLLTPFYLELLKQTHNVWLKFNDFQKVWQEELIDWVNKSFDKRFHGNKWKIISYLKGNNLMDLWHDWIEADRSYSVLSLEWVINTKWVKNKKWLNNKKVNTVKKIYNYSKLAYLDAFPKEINNIVNSLDLFIEKLRKHEDDIYNEKDNYITYIGSLKAAFLETDTDRLVKKWSEVDEAWMQIKGPFQIGHPLEYYEDQYRKAVAPEWDLRLKNTSLFESKVETNMISMFNERFKEFWAEEYKEIYDFSIKSLSNVWLYISSLLFYYGSSLNWNISAQVIPNDTKASERYWKKIFAFPEKLLEREKTRPITKMATWTFEEWLFKKIQDIHSNEVDFYKLYDIETNWHEFWHTLWLDWDTETKMNVWWNFKNIEEFKATSWGMIAYLSNPDKELFDKWLIQHIDRSISLMWRSDISEVEPYYCEGLIHLKILFDSEIIFINEDKKIELNLYDETLEAFKKWYFETYSKLVKLYLNKENADIFLSDYTINEWGKFLPKDEKIKRYVRFYIEQDEKLGNKIDENYIK